MGRLSAVAPTGARGADCRHSRFSSLNPCSCERPGGGTLPSARRICQRTAPLLPTGASIAHFDRENPQRPAPPRPAHRTAGAEPALAVPARLPQASGDGRIDHPVEPDADRQDARPGRLGAAPSCSSNMARASAPSPGRSSRSCRPDATLDRDRHQRRVHPLPAANRSTTRGWSPVTGSAADVETDHRATAASSMPITCCRACPSRPCRRASATRSARRRRKVIRPGGAFLVYQFSPKVLDFIKPLFERIDRGFEWINVPPAKPVLGVAGAARLGFDSRPEVEPPRDGVIHRRHQPVRGGPFEPAPQGRALAVQARR